jgi:hypothetical protein
LKPHRASVVRDVWDRLLDFFIAAWLGLPDRLAPLPETAVDRAIREEGQRPAKGLPRDRFRQSRAAEPPA